MKAYYASKISENISETPEGYLICRNVPISRTGMQEYFGQEVGLNDLYDQKVPVYREEDEVFSRASMASFEGKPTCDDHPLEDVTAENAGIFGRGVAVNIRRGEGEDSDKLVADLIIHDKQLADEIRNGKRDISCGYTCDYEQVDGKLYQKNIRGNHVAVVAAGRAGPEVSIKDSKPKAPKGKERSFTMSLKKQDSQKKGKGWLVGRFLATLSTTDAEPEVVAALAEELVDALDENAAVDNEAVDNDTPQDTQPPAANGSAGDSDDPVMAAIRALSDQVGAIADTVAGMQAAKDTDPLDEIIDQLEGDSEAADNDPEQWEATDEDTADSDAEDEGTEDNDTTDEETADVDPDEGTAPVGVSDKALAQHLRAMKPLIAKLPPAQRQKAADSLTSYARRVMGKGKGSQKDGYAAILRGQQAAARKRAKDSKPVDHAALGVEIAQRHNPHYKNK